MRHSWDVTPTEAIGIQKSLADLVHSAPLTGPVRTVAGVDCAFTDDGGILAAAVLCDAETMAPLVSADIVQPCRFPYVPGLLSFREAPAILAVLDALRLHAQEEGVADDLDLVMCDGQGIAHPRGLGLASHVGLWLGRPTIGVAKSRLCGEHRDPAPSRGSRAALRLGGRVVGTVLRTRDAVRPLYVSVGHAITLAEAVAWVLRSGRGRRLPEPTRLADQLVTRCKRGEH